MIKIFIEKCSESIDTVDEMLKAETKRLHIRKKNYINTIDKLDGYFRSEKIQRIKEKIQND